MNTILLVIWFGAGNVANSISVMTTDLARCERAAAIIKRETYDKHGVFERGQEFRYRHHDCIDLGGVK